MYVTSVENDCIGSHVVTGAVDCDSQEIGRGGVLSRAGRPRQDECRRDARAKSDELSSSTHTTTSLR